MALIGWWAGCWEGLVSAYGIPVLGALPAYDTSLRGKEDSGIGLVSDRPFWCKRFHCFIFTSRLPVFFSLLQ